MNTNLQPRHDAPLPKGILVVDDHELLRLGLRTLVQSHAQGNGQAVTVFEAHSLQEALAMFGKNATAIQLVLLDLHLPDAHGLSGLRAFKSQYPDAHVIVLSGSSDPGLQRDALAMGARAYLTKSGDLDQVVHYIASMDLPSLHKAPNPSPQEQAFPTASATGGAPLAMGRSVRTTTGEWVQLTVRQAQVLDWILIGWSNRQIADHAKLSEGTVKNHVSTLLLTLGARSRAQLISQLR
ncbi:hypothetical protein LPB72_21495 [Hydrogenophaga crassostreae]|uniref:DNA-binding response regulator n=1 Tax=Hydrogenophaga crassostreae TaxID=1763535 RepID=A0A162SQS0_9BURK|nr:response regulator transcription factor [Hydrogenophaga crassostreae]AOW15098.1 hypothetical protein LPB072_22110 [Hydrogenophaga crassostreae]OAD39552.1 hypothetical protein LPB72_21495 [Hydrogenophaga crassostreae]